MLLRFVSEAVGQAPVVLVGAYREREAQLHERPELFAELARFGPRLSLQGLEVNDVEAYVQGVTGQETSRSAAARLHVLTGGNPFFLGEVLRLVEPEGLTRRGLPIRCGRSRRRSGCCCAAGSPICRRMRSGRSAWRPWWAASFS